MYLEIFLADFAFFWEFRGISRKYLNFAGPRLREISEALPYLFENDNEQAGYVFSQYLHYDTEILSFFLHPDVDFSQVEY